MSGVASGFAALLAVTSTLAGLLGAWRWWTVDPSELFWKLLRGSQACAALFVLAAGVLFLAGFEPGGDLFWLYALLPVGVGFVSEQLRLSAAHTVLDARDLEDAQAVGQLPDDEQRSVVLQIVRREMGVMAVSALVVAFLALRAIVEV